MGTIENYDRSAAEYDLWFDRHPEVFRSEIDTLRPFCKGGPDSVEIGAGTGRFAAALGIPLGLEPAEGMAGIARKHGVRVVSGKAEDLPFPDDSLSEAVMITVLGFLEDPAAALRECFRILRPGGIFVIAVLSAEGPVAKYYRGREGVYFDQARFYKAVEVIELLGETGFTLTGSRQTLFDYPSDAYQAPLPGHDRGGFVVFRAGKPES